MSGPAKPGSMFLRPQRSGGKIVRPGLVIPEQQPVKTTVESPKSVRQSQGMFSSNQPTDEFDPKDVPEDQVETFDPREVGQTGSGSRLLRWFTRFAPH